MIGERCGVTPDQIVVAGQGRAPDFRRFLDAPEAPEGPCQRDLDLGIGGALLRVREYPQALGRAQVRGEVRRGFRMARHERERTRVEGAGAQGLAPVFCELRLVAIDPSESERRDIPVSLTRKAQKSL